MFVQRLQGLLYPLSPAQTSCSLSLLFFCNSHICLLFLCHQLLKPALLLGGMMSHDDGFAGGDHVSTFQICIAPCWRPVHTNTNVQRENSYLMHDLSVPDSGFKHFYLNECSVNVNFYRSYSLFHRTAKKTGQTFNSCFWSYGCLAK